MGIHIENQYRDGTQTCKKNMNAGGFRANRKTNKHKSLTWKRRVKNEGLKTPWVKTKESRPGKYDD